MNRSGPCANSYDLVAGANLALLEHAEIKPRSVVRHQQGRDAWIVHANSDAIACHAGLRHFEQRAPDAIPVADAHLVVRQTLYGEVLAELPEDEIAAAQGALPVMIRVDLVDHHRTLLAAVTGKISLPIPLEVESPRHAPPVNWGLPNAGMHGLAAPLDVLRQTDVDREQSRHESAHSIKYVD